MKNLIKIYLLVFMAFGLFSCENEEFLYQDVSSRLIVGSSKVVSFMLQEEDAEQDTVYLNVTLVGAISDVDRSFEMDVLSDSTNVGPTAYELGYMVLPAGSYTASIPIIVKRSVDGLDLTDWENGIEARLTLLHVENENFLFGPNSQEEGSGMFSVTWIDYLAKPDEWDDVFTSSIGEFSQARYRFIIMVVGHSNIDNFTTYTTRLALQSTLRRAIKEYNELADAEGREHYKDDDGSDLTF